MRNKIFIDRGMQWLTLAYLVFFGIVVVSTNHGEFVLWLSDRHFAIGDLFFKYWTKQDYFEFYICLILP